MKIFAHRGASRYAPENTMPAFKLAEKQGADGIELDLQLTKDNIPVIFHDEKIKRTTNGVGFIKDYTFKELQQFDAGSWFNRAFKDTKIISFTEFLEWFVDTKLLLNAELKTNVFDYRGIEEIVLHQIEKYDIKDRTTVSSFNEKSIERARKLDSNIQLAWLTSRAIPEIDRFLNHIGANQIHIKTSLVPSRMVNFLNAQQIPFRVYTVNRPIHFRRALQFNAEGIFTDLPDVMRQLISTSLA